ncbi:MAG TPA: NPCBM/NEW2 domain-containing protein [Actinomycetota bacterium]|nr:NPCBM/NEW2 domain-containing protein [Actinomycetota bacterium]
MGNTRRRLDEASECIVAWRQLLQLAFRRLTRKGEGECHFADNERLVGDHVLCSDAFPIAADVEGIARLTLVVTAGGDGNAFDHADWGDARLDCGSG